MKLQKFILSIAVLLLVNLNVNGSDSLITYTNAHHGISFKYPSSWRCTPISSHMLSIEINNPVEIKANLNNYRNIMIIVFYGQGDAGTILGEGVVSLKKAGEDLKGYHFISEDVPQINGKQFFSKSFSYEDAGRIVYENDYYYMVNNRVIVIKQSAVQQNKLLVGELNEILNSFTTTPPYSDNRRQMSDTLVLAAWNGNLEKVKDLLASGASVNDVNSQGIGVLHAVAQNKSYEQFSYLLEKGADPNYVYGFTLTTPVFWVNRTLNDRGKLNFYQLLIDKGADLSVKNYNGKTIYQVLKEQVYLKDDAKFLKSKGAK